MGNEGDWEEDASVTFLDKNDLRKGWFASWFDDTVHQGGKAQQ